VRLEPRWLMPAESRNAPSAIWARDFINVMG
jgi:hypothetical protein